MDKQAFAREIAATIKATARQQMAEQFEALRKKLQDDIPAPVKGDPGEPGFGFDDMTVEHDGERGFTLKFTQGDREKTFDFQIPAMIDRGVYKDGTEYERGDAVTFGGSLWIAQRSGPDGKPGQSDAWRLAVKKGRDGRS